MSNPVLELRNVRHTYGSDVEVLRGVDLRVEAGEVVALVGQSGAGKSTLLQIAGLLDSPTSGEVRLNGEIFTSDANRTLARRKYMGFVYQMHHLLPEFSALENVALPLIIAGTSPARAKPRAMELLKEVGLEPRAHHRPAQLSGGERQRTAIARALANAPKLLLADEPTGNLDPEAADNVFSLLMRLARDHGTAALIATHNLDLATRMNRTVRLQGGVLK